MLRLIGNAQPRPRCLQVRTDEQRLPGANHIFGEGVVEFSRALRKHSTIFYFQLETYLISLLKSDVEVAGVKNLPQFTVDGAQDLILIESRTDRLSDLGEQLVLLGAAVSVVRNQVVVEGQAELQREAHHQPRARGAKRSAVGVGK